MQCHIYFFLMYTFVLYTRGIINSSDLQQRIRMNQNIIHKSIAREFFINELLNLFFIFLHYVPCTFISNNCVPNRICNHRMSVTELNSLKSQQIMNARSFIFCALNPFQSEIRIQKNSAFVYIFSALYR